MPEDQRETRFDLVLFGGTGDLALRKLMPALYYGMRDGGLRGANIVGSVRIVDVREKIAGARQSWSSIRMERVIASTPPAFAILSAWR